MFLIRWHLLKRPKKNLGYDPEYDINAGLKEAVLWYWNNLKR